MKKKKNKAISSFSAQVTSTVSVALVLLTIGIIAFLGIAARSLTNEIKENMGFNIVFSENSTTEQFNSLKQYFTSSPAISSVRYFSREHALEKWQQETGENLMDVLGINPFNGELEVKVKARYANTDSITSLAGPWQDKDYIEEVVFHTEVVDSINKNISSIALILSIVAIALLFISFVLINNTVRLTVYSRRFIIHTMKLVGATGAFIRRPFVLYNVTGGIIAGAIASAVLAGILGYFTSMDNTLTGLITWLEASFVFAGLIVLGAIICALAATFATNKYLRTSYDNMFD